ncbi:hypothetical protein GCM10023339_43980 [Alloalcanivorax gelatiniphagus]
MLVKIWAVTVDPTRVAEYREFVRTRSQPMFEQQSGFLDVVFLESEDGLRHAAVSTWSDRTALAALDTSESYRVTASALLGSGMVVGEPDVHVWHVTRHAPPPP